MKAKDKIIGTVIYHNEFKSEYVPDRRTVVVWLPPGYKKSSERYCVVYMHDGQNLFDPKTSFAGKDWRVDETACRLIKKKEISKIIVVGIYNTPNRIEEYSYSDSGKNYLKFIVNELKPFIDSNYRTKPGRENTAVMGSSMGGLISFLLAWNYPEIFSKAACLSSSFYYDGGIALKLVESSVDEKNIKIYIDHGEDGKIFAQKIFCALTAKGFLIGENLDYFYKPGAQHNEDEWAERLSRPLRFLFPFEKS